MTGGQFFGGLLFAVGALMATLSGLCSLGLVASTLPTLLRGPQVLSNLLMGVVMVGLFGGLPFAMGVAVMIAGRAVMRPSPPPRRPDEGPEGRGAP